MGAAALALAVLAYAPRAHECVMDPPHRWRRHLVECVAVLDSVDTLVGLMVSRSSAGLGDLDFGEGTGESVAGGDG